jgi:uncharacterized protein YukE
MDLWNLDMGFWVKHLVAATILLILAALILFNPHWLEPTPATQSGTVVRKSASLEFTNFYEQLRYSLDATADRAKEFVIQLTDTSDTLEETLQARTDTVLPMASNWQGAVAIRKFLPDQQLREQMRKFAAAEGLELIWTLPRDYIIKHHFQDEGSYLATLTEVGRAIAPDFEFPVLVYFCPVQRAAVVTDKQSLFLEQNCRHLNPEPVKKRQIPAAN